VNALLTQPLYPGPRSPHRSHASHAASAASHTIGLDRAGRRVHSRSARVTTRARQKLGVAATGAATFAAVLASYGTFRPVRDALLLDSHPDSIPWIFLATFLTVAAASALWSAVLARRAPRRFVAWVFHVFAACLVGFAIAVGTKLAPISVGRAFYVWSAMFNLFAVSVCWSLFADLLGPRTARQLYGPITAGGTLGAIAGPLLSRVLVGTIGVAGVLALSALLLELAVLGAAAVRRAATSLAEDAAGDTAIPRVTTARIASTATGAPLAGGGPFTGIAQVARSPFLSAIVGYVLCTACAATFLYLAQARIVYDAHLDREARTAYFASIDTWTQLAALTLQLAIAGPALRWLGPGLVLAVLPLTQAIGLSLLAAVPSLAVLAAVQVASKAVTHGLTRPARELLFTVVSRDDKYRAKNAIDTIGYRFGDLGASWLDHGLAALGQTALALATFPLAVLWLVLAAVLGNGFRRRAAPPTDTTTSEPP